MSCGLPVLVVEVSMSTLFPCPAPALDFAALLARRLENASPQSLTREDVKIYLKIGRDLRESLLESRQAFTNALSEGVSVLPPPTEPLSETPGELAPLGSRVRNLAATLRALPNLPEYVADLVDEMEQLAQEMLASDRLLKDFSAAANAPRRPFPIERVRQAEEAFARGETKRLEKVNLNGGH
jgi:hypothetical protein